MFAREDDEATAPPIWPVFGDLMACLFGLFVLFVWAITFQVDLSHDLAAEKESREREAEARAAASARLAAQSDRLAALERALAGPLAAGRITLVEGRIGIRGSVLFDLNSSGLKSEGATVLGDVAGPLKTYLEQHDEMIMVSGFTDDLPVRGAGAYRDNWALSAERALTVTRALIVAGIKDERLFAAGFGETHPVAPNDSAENRAKNRRVEIVPVPRAVQAAP